MKSAKYDLFCIKIDELLIFKSDDFSPFLTEGEVEKGKRRGKCQLLKVNYSSILIQIKSYFVLSICNFL